MASCVLALAQMLRLSASLSVLLLIGGCSEKPPTAPDPATQITLSLSSPVSVANLGVELTLLSVLDDIRCVSGDSACDWPGMATLSVRIVQETDTNIVNLSISGEFPLDASRFLWPLDTLGLRLIMLSLSPTGSNSPIPLDNYRATVQIERSSGGLRAGPNVIITALEPSAILVDPFDIDSVWITSDRLHLAVTYSGGCRRHLFSLFMSPETFINSSPNQANLHLRHYRAGDACRAVVHEELVFNLGIVAQKYRFAYAIEEPFQLNLIIPAFNENEERVISLIFNPPISALP